MPFFFYIINITKQQWRKIGGGLCMIYGLIVFGIIVLICTGVIFTYNLDECTVDDVGICLVLSFISGIMLTLYLIIVISLPVLICASIMSIITSII